MLTSVRVINDMTNEAYQDAAGLSRSDALCILDHGTLTAKYRKENRQVKSSPAMEFGTMFHTAMESLHEFERKYYIEPAGDKRTKAVKDAIEQMKADFPDKTLVPEKDYLAVLDMHHAIIEHPQITPLFTGSYREVELSLFGEMYDVLIKARPDAVFVDAGVIVDWKTTQDASKPGFSKSVSQFGYWMQPVWYKELVEAYFGKPFRFLFVAVEKEAPFNVAVYELGPKYDEIAGVEMRQAVAMWRNSERTGKWTAYPESVQTLDAPDWMVQSIGKVVTL